MVEDVAQEVAKENMDAAEAPVVVTESFANDAEPVKVDDGQAELFPETDNSGVAAEPAKVAPSESAAAVDMATATVAPAAPEPAADPVVEPVVEPMHPEVSKEEGPEPAGAPNNPDYPQYTTSYRG